MEGECVSCDRCLSGRRGLKTLDPAISLAAIYVLAGDSFPESCGVLFSTLRLGDKDEVGEATPPKAGSGTPATPRRRADVTSHTGKY